MSLLDELYRMGSNGVVDTPGHVSTTQGQAAIAIAERLARAIHIDVMRSGVRPEFRRAWQTFYNRWLTYQTLHAPRELQSDPARVIDIEVPRFVEGLHRWRTALADEPGGGVKMAGRVGSETAKGFPWRPVLLAASAGALALGVRWWWQERDRAKEEERERLAAIKAQAATLAMGPSAAYAATLPAVAVPPPPGWPAPPTWALAPTLPAMPAVPPGYALVRTG